jgi:ABC-type sugar transport system ATPase subunit
MRGIRKSFAGNEVLHGVDLAVRAGQVHALIGHNGAGKSTLMKVLGGVYPDYAGTIGIDGDERRMLTPKEALAHGVAVIYQDFALVPDLDVAHNIALGREPLTGGGRIIPHRRLVERSAEEADRFGIDLPMRTPVRRLGVAAQQLTEIVRALARDVRYLVMDEPTARLAPAEREQLFRIIRSLAERGVGIVYISHFLDEVVEVADVVTVLRDGHVVAHRRAAECTPDGLATELVGPEETAVVEAHEQRREPAVDGPPRLRARGLQTRPGVTVDLDVHAGEVVALAGLVGSGRTRLARALIGDLRVPGRVEVDGSEVAPRNPATSARRGLLLVPEDRKRSGLVLTGSIRSNIELTALGTTLSRFGLVLRRATDTVVASAIRHFRIRPPDQHMLAGALSGGNAQKVLVARAVAADPRVIVFDQPTAGVDIGAKAELHARLLDLARSGTAVLVISDDLDEMLELADRVLVFVAGRIAAELPASELSRSQLLSAISRTVEVA